LKNEQIIGACGLVCNNCDIYEASTNREIALNIANWFKKERNLDVKIEDIGCNGCKGDREKHWSPDCWILQCCVHNRGLEFCCECDEFPCEKLVEWANESERYSDALQRLEEMKE
jgi:hypothetical protein